MLLFLDTLGNKMTTIFHEVKNNHHLSATKGMKYLDYVKLTIWFVTKCVARSLFEMILGITESFSQSVAMPE